jgi:hypothetical protein
MPIQGASVRTELSGLRIPYGASGAVVRWAGIKLMLDRAARRPKPWPLCRSAAIVRVSRQDPRT